LLYLRDCGPTEVGGFAIAATDDPLLVTDLQLVDQVCSSVSVAFDDRAVADFFDQQVDAGLRPVQFARIWVHTHPGDCPEPSLTDEETFERVFGPTDWAVMFILARGGQSYCRLQFNVGPGGAVELPVEVDYCKPFPASDELAWEAEYRARVQPVPKLVTDSELIAVNGRSQTQQLTPRTDDLPWFLGGDDSFDYQVTQEENWYDY